MRTYTWTPVEGTDYRYVSTPADAVAKAFSFMQVYDLMLIAVIDQSALWAH